MRQLLQNGTYKTLSELYKNLFQNLVDVCVVRELQGEFYYALDEIPRHHDAENQFAAHHRRVVLPEEDIFYRIYRFLCAPVDLGSQYPGIVKMLVPGMIVKLRLVDVCVVRELQGEFYYALDEMNRYQMTAGWFRRSLRSDSYAPFVEQSIKLLRAYARLDFYGGGFPSSHRLTALHLPEALPREGICQDLHKGIYPATMSA